MTEFCERCGERFDSVDDLISHAGKRLHELGRSEVGLRHRSVIGWDVLRSYDPTRG